MEHLNILDYDYYFSLTEGFLENNPAKALLVFDEIQKKGFDGQLFLSGLASHFRDLLVCQSPDTLNLLEVPGNIAEKYRAQAKAVPDAFLLNALSVVEKYDQSYKTSNNQRLHVELALIKLSHLQQAIHLLEELKKKSLSQ